MAEPDRDHLDCFRGALRGALMGAYNNDDLNERGVSGLYVTVMVAARAELFADDPEMAMREEVELLDRQINDMISPN